MYFPTLLLMAGLLSAGPDENILQDTLQTIVVVADKGVVVSKTDTLTIKPGAGISEALMQSPALLIGDNGGAAGLKTVNLRGLGSAHTEIYIDGVRVGNVQSGQGDLTNLGAQQFSSAVVDYAQNSISFTTARPEFNHGHKVSGQVRMNGGSFGTWNPYGRLNFKLSELISLSADVEGLGSKGNFQYGDALLRDNNDMRQLSTGFHVFGLTNGGKWHIKAHYNGVDRGTPGSLTYPSTDRQADRNTYIQGHIDEQFSGIYTLTASAKYAFDRLDYMSEWGDSRYDQQEAQINSSHRFAIARWLTLSLAADLVWDKLNSDAYNAERYSPQAALAAAFRAERFSADIAVGYNGAIDKNGLSRSTISPSADLRWDISNALNINAFSRRAYRVPVFNELYYAGYGNPELRPEDAWLNGAGLSFGKVLGCWTIKASADGFLNLLSDKIISAPSQADPYLWLPYNVGKVRSCGADLSAGFEFAEGKWDTGLCAKYCCQSAIDRTPDSASFGQQIPYISKHTACLSGFASANGWKLDAVWNLRAGRRDSYGDMPDWNTLDVTLSKIIKLRNCGPVTIFISGKNLLACRYESVSGYPMPGRSVTGGIEFKF